MRVFTLAVAVFGRWLKLGLLPRSTAMVVRRGVALMLLASVSVPAAAQPQPCPTSPAEGERLLAVVSDLHFGVGREANGRWNATEDFRWPDALAGFLAELGRCGNDRVDLVVAGDLLELWQPPGALACRSQEADLGCTPAELAGIVRAVLHEHQRELNELARFAARGDNRLVIVPGNHDAALLLPEAWSLLEQGLAAPVGRVQRAASGVYAWAGGRIVVEHGHQIGTNVNRFADWPAITRVVNGKAYVLRPWGELFVQRLFNAQEQDYPIVDNLSPEAAGARARMADRGVWGSAADLAQFMAFNLVETSLAQKGQMLGGDKKASAFDPVLARRQGHKLVAATLAPDDTLRTAVEAQGVDGEALRQELDALVRDTARMPEADLRALCELGAQRMPDAAPCAPALLGSVGSAMLLSKRLVLAEHLRRRLAEEAFRPIQVFVYAHTHVLEAPWDIEVNELRRVTVLNTGAFQRVVDEPGFRMRARAKGWTAAEALKKLRVEDLAPCYGVVLATSAKGERVRAQTYQWLQAEGAATGRLVTVGEEACR